MKKQKVLISMSGGLDSCVLAAYYLDKGFQVGAVNFIYGSKHNEYETESFDSLVEAMSLSSVYRINAFNLFNHTKSDLLQTGGDIPEGHYQEEKMRATVIPGRNLIFASIMASIAESNGYDIIALGVHAGDHFIYPDCRPFFIQMLAKVVHASTQAKVFVEVPLLFMSKAEIVSMGTQLSAPLSLTRTCYKDQPIPCGKCGSCIERLEAFKENGIDDTLIYEQEK